MDLSTLTPEHRLRALDLELPAAPPGVGAYVPWTRTGNLILTSYQLPWRRGELAFTGRLGETVSVEQGIEAARICALNGLAQLHEAAGGDLAHLRILRLDGHVGCSAEFLDIPRVLNGASELLKQVLGSAHARTALGHHVMPLNVPVMLGFVAEVVPA
jgi:enamine deaminase RidA (YjgF/YER057c/UK114 family)